MAMVGTMTEKQAKRTSDVKQSRSAGESQNLGDSTAVKSEKLDAEVEAKLRALNARARVSRSKSHEIGGAETEAEPGEDKKEIAPVKSSNEILAELFGVFNAAPPEELLDDKNLLKKHKKEKKEKKKKDKEKSKSRKLPKLSDGECSETEAEGKKHKHKRKKHKHKDTKEKDKHRDGERIKEKISLDAQKVSVGLLDKDKEKEKSENRKRLIEVDNASEYLAVKRERLEKDRERERERERGHNSFYNGNRDTVRSRDAIKPKNRTAHDQSDVSLSDEESYLREKASNGRGRRLTHNTFYGEPKENQRHDHPTSSNHRHRRPRSRTRSRSRPRDLRIDKKRLLEIARKNAISMFKRGSLPGVDNMTPEVKDKVLLKMRYGGRTVQDLTEFCKKISSGDNLSDLSSEEDSDVDKNGNAKAFHHPFQIKEREPIVMHIRNSTPIVPSTAAQREEQTKAITMQFPVSSGQVHRMNEVWVPVDAKDSSLVPLPVLPPVKQATNLFKDVQKNVFAKPIPQQEQQKPAFTPIASSDLGESQAAMPNGSLLPSTQAPELVSPPSSVCKPASTCTFVAEVPIPSVSINDTPGPPPPTSAASASIFPVSSSQTMDVSSIITQRLSAIRRLQDNPADSEAIKMMYNAQRDMSSWASSKHLPGQFTGSTGAQVMKIHELNSGPQLWARRDQLTATKPVTGGMGMALLQKMGWKPGEGLGRSKSGSLQPLLLDVKLDKRGLVSREDIKQQQQPQRSTPAHRKNKNPMAGSVPAAVAPGAATLNTQEKHPVCVLNELTSKNKWTPPQYVLQQNTGPAHMRTFLFSVEINGQTYTPSNGCNSKKEAKLNAAKLCLKSLGILPHS